MSRFLKKCLDKRLSASPPGSKDEREKYPPFEGEVDLRGELVYLLSMRKLKC